MTEQKVMRSNTQLSRPRLIEQHISAYLRETGTSQMAYAASVVESYHANVPKEQRCIEFSSRDDVFERTKRDAEKIMRYLDGGSCRLPVELEEALIMSLPIDRRTALVYELNARLGCISVFVGDSKDEQITQEVVMKEIGEGLVALSSDDIDAQVKELREAAVAANARADYLAHKKAAGLTTAQTKQIVDKRQFGN